MSESSIQQRVFDAFPTHPTTIRIGDFHQATPYLRTGAIRTAVYALVRKGIVERIAQAGYRLVQNAARPRDNRGGKRHGAGRKTRGA